MINLHSLENTLREHKRRKRVGRGAGSGMGKTSGRGEKGAGSRAGYRRRLGYEGGQFRLFMKLPIRGFSNARFRKELHTINLDQIQAVFSDGDVINIQTLKNRGFISGRTHGIKILGNGELTKKVTIEATCVSTGAQEKLSKAKINYTVKSAQSS